MRLDEGFNSKEEARAERQRRKLAGEKPRERLNRDQRIHTPPEFRDLLIAIARSVRPATPLELVLGRLE